MEQVVEGRWMWRRLGSAWWSDDVDFINDLRTPRIQFCNDSEETRQRSHRLRLCQVPLQSLFCRLLIGHFGVSHEFR